MYPVKQFQVEVCGVTLTVSNQLPVAGDLCVQFLDDYSGYIQAVFRVMSTGYAAPIIIDPVTPPLENEYPIYYCEVVRSTDTRFVVGKKTLREAGNLSTVISTKELSINDSE